MDTPKSHYAFSKKQTIWLLIAQIAGCAILFATAPKPYQVVGETFVPGNLPLQLWGGLGGGEGFDASPLWVQGFLFFLSVMAYISVIFMPKRLEARWAGGGLLAGVIITFFVVPNLPIVSLGGMYAVLHFILWLPGFYLLLKNRPFMNERNFYGLWCGIVTFIMIFSFIFDVRDIFIYLPYIWNLPR